MRVKRLEMTTPEQQEDIVLEYFGSEESKGRPLCPNCGDRLDFRSFVLKAFGLQLKISCQGCSETFSWSQPQPERSWKDLHLEYFLENHGKGEVARCPYDDCQVSCAEFAGGVLQFNCPYCNRRGRIRLEI